MPRPGSRPSTGSSRRPAPAGRPGADPGSVPLVGDPAGDPGRDRPAGRQQLLRRSRAHGPARRAEVRPGRPGQDRGVPGRPPGRRRGAVRDRPARAPRRPAPPRRPRRTRPGSTTWGWSPPPTTTKPAPARRSTSPGCRCCRRPARRTAVTSRAPWAAHFGLARTPFGKSIAAKDLFARQAHAQATARISFCIDRNLARRHHRRRRRRENRGRPRRRRRPGPHPAPGHLRRQPRLRHPRLS